MVNLGLSRVDDAVAAKHPPGCAQRRDRRGGEGRGQGIEPSPASATPGTRGVCRMPVTRLHEGRFHLRHRHRHGLRLADVHSEEVSIPFAVEPSSGRGCRLCGQLRGDKSGVREMQQPLALPGDRAAPQRHEHRSAKLGELQPGHGGLGAGGVWNTAFMPPDPRLTLPTP
ncbi:transmembrane protein 141 isoform X2 [Pongo abelii]|uniref:Transmembrane protein 141 n=1 Tax=Pongo abelii TaxID=9601 RepID=A0A8I5YQ23_PONAB